ncbi:MAG: tetratricopeptide repeat protein [Defluviitaleaceae bacterium]|nr:tetratricopeptide repeat protein [Defluviitaleaceae bacterium]
MKPIPYDQMELERLCTRIQTQYNSAFFCVTIDNILLHRTIIEAVLKHFPEGDMQVIDFQQMHGTRYSSELIESLIEKGTRYVVLPHFHLANDNAMGTAFFHALNMSRDVLADMPVVFVFIVPMYFRVQLARYAPDFHSFFQYYARFDTERKEDEIPQRDTVEPYSEVNKHLLDYYYERLGGILDTQSKEYFETLVEILVLNASVRTLEHREHGRFYMDFCKLLPMYEDDANIAIADIAMIFESQGDYPKALEWYFKALAIYEKSLGTEHLSIAITYNNIALVYKNQGDYPKALEWYFKALAIKEKNLGTEHPNTAATYNNIAGVYMDQGDYPKALEWYFKALAIKEKTLGAEHPSTAATYNNIASVYKNQGNYPIALEWYFKALVICEKTLGTEHPNTATTNNNIALVYADQGDYPKALSLLLKCYTIELKIFGETNPHTLNTKSNLESIYNDATLPQPFEVWFAENFSNR